MTAGRVQRCCPYTQGSGRGIAQPELVEESTKVRRFLGRLAERHYFCFAGRERDGGLLLTAPGDQRLGVHEAPAGGGVTHGPIRVAHAGEVAVTCAVSEADVTVVMKVVQHT